MPQIFVFGKQNCPKCASTKRKLDHFLSKWKLDKDVPVVFQDMGTREGLAESCFRDVWEIPTTIVEDDKSSECLARWSGEIPHSQQLREQLNA